MKIDESKEAAIKREIRLAIVQDPMISVRRLQDRLFERGFKTSNNNEISKEYLLKLVHKLNGEAVRVIRDSEIEGRLAQTKQRFSMIFERLFKIAFWEWKYMEEGIFMPEVKDQIKAMEAIMKMDIALIQAEMDAGIFKRNLGTLEIQKRNAPLTPERKTEILDVLKNWGFPITANVTTTPNQPEPSIGSTQ